MKKFLFDQIVIAFGVYIGVDISPVVEALEVMVYCITPKIKK